MRAILIALAVMVSGAAWACTAQDIKVTQFNAFPTADFTRIVGAVRNNCSSPVEIRLQAVFRMKSGEIVDVYEFNAKSLGGVVAPGEEAAFASSHDLWGRKYELFDVGVANVRNAR